MKKSNMLGNLIRDFFASLLWGLCLSVQAQEVICVQGRQGNLLLDIGNVREMRVEPGALTADFGSLNLCVPFDTLSFAGIEQEGLRMGWWGGIDDGESTCYYWPDSTNVPNVKMNSTVGCCDVVRSYIRNAPSHNPMPRRVGGKWRYTLGTLTGRRRVQVTCFRATCFEHYQIFEREDNPDYSEANMSVMFEGKPSRVVGNVLDYWYLPSGSHEMPESPVFGDFDGWRYELPLVDDSLTVVVRLIPGSADMVVGDSMQLVFRDANNAQRTYSEMGDIGDEEVSVSLYGNVVSVVEHFEATMDEVRRWVVRFDLDLYKPLFLRKDE